MRPGSCLLALPALLAFLGCVQPARQDEAGEAAAAERPAAGPVRGQVGEPVPTPPELPRELDVFSVPVIERDVPATFEVLPPPPGTGKFEASDVPVPRTLRPRPIGFAAVDPQASAAPGAAAPAFSTTFDSTDFDDNGTETGGFRFIPPDSHAAAGPDHLVNVVNVTVRFYQKDGTLDFSDALRDLFALEGPATFTFDPKVLYDQYAGRFLIVTLERQDTCSLIGDPADDSKIFLAVSDDADPNGTWYTTTINGMLTMGSPAAPRWADYPGFAVDEEAVYITANYFSFGAEVGCGGSTFGGVRLRIVDKGLGSGGFYDGGAATVSAPYNPYACGPCVATTTQPAHVYGAAPAGIGTWLVSYSGLTDGLNEAIQTVRVNNPLGLPFFTHQFVSVGDIENSLFFQIPNAPQLDLPPPGGAQAIETNDRRALDAIWRDDSLWVTATIEPNAPPADAGESTAYFAELDTTGLGVISLVQQGQIGGEDISADTHTFFPSIAVASDNEVAIGFSASSSTIHPGSYYTTRAAGDPAGTTSGSVALRTGADEYVRTFGSGSNRWGDYSGAVLDPATECFWIYNQHAIARGTLIGGEDGRWGTAFGEACACSASFALTTGQWKQISTPCAIGPADTVADVFGEDLGGTYGVNWIVYERDAVNDVYVPLALTDAMTEHRGYWIKTNAAAQTVEARGLNNAVTEVALESDAAGRFNMVGHPFGFDVCWADAEVIDGAMVLSLAAADPDGACQGPDPLANGCVMSSVAHKWTGAGYAPFDGVTSGMEGTLVPWDGFWVKAFKSGIRLRIPDTGGNCGAPAAPVASSAPRPGGAGGATAEGWFVRLIAEAGAMRDAGNVFGQLPGSHRGYDRHDLEELAPFGSDFLTVVFPHPNWRVNPGDYATDFHRLRPSRRGDIWRFEVRTSAPGEATALSWEGPDGVLERSVLFDLESREAVRPSPGGRYEFVPAGPSHRFAWLVR